MSRALRKIMWKRMKPAKPERLAPSLQSLSTRPKQIAFNGASVHFLGADEL
jgi:hypothetical protein